MRKRRGKGEGRREKGEGRREKGEGRREKGEGRREKGEGRREEAAAPYGRRARTRAIGESRRRRRPGTTAGAGPGALVHLVAGGQRLAGDGADRRSLYASRGAQPRRRPAGHRR